MLGIFGSTYTSPASTSNPADPEDDQLILSSIVNESFQIQPQAMKGASLA
jgi:hypothetical protein